MNIPAACFRPLRILYIDDDAEIAYVFKTLAERAGHLVKLEIQPTLALEWLSNNPGTFDLVVTDYRMPGLNGLEVASALRRRCPDLRCAIVSSDLSDELVNGAAAAGINLLFRKPTTPAELADLIKRCCA